MSYNIKNYTEQGGEKTVINGEIIINGKLIVNDEAVVEGVERNPYTLPVATLSSIGGVIAAENLTDTKATNLDGLKKDFNSLLVKLKTAGIIEKDKFAVSVIGIPTPIGTEITVNHSKVESITYENNLVTVKVPLDELVDFDAGASGQGIHKWLGLSISTGLSSIIGVLYNESYTLAQVDVNEATTVGCPAGSFVLWIKCEELTETIKVITISKPGFETVVLSIIVESV